MKNLNEPKQGFWGALARKAKAILDDDNEPQQLDTPGKTTKVEMPPTAARSKVRLHIDSWHENLLWKVYSMQVNY